MPRATPTLVGFSGGEVSPQLAARSDLDKSAISVREMLNFIARPQGPAVRRPGFRYVATARGNGMSRLIPFEFSAAQAYIVEASPDGFLRFYRDGGVILSGSLPYEIAHPYGADLAALQWVQSADVLYLAHPRFSSRKLSRTGNTAWTLTEIAFQDGPFGDVKNDLTITPSLSFGASVLLTASAALFTTADVGRLIRLQHDAFVRVASTVYAAGACFFTFDAGIYRTYRVVKGGTTSASPILQEGDHITDGTAVLRYLGRGARVWGWGRIISYGSAFTVLTSVDTAASFSATLASRQYAMGEWFGENWPSTATFHDGRLWWGGSLAKPQTLWSSKSGDFENMQGGPAADDALTLTLDTDQVNALRWMRSARALVVGTSGAEFAVQAQETGAVLAPNNATARRQTAEGSAAVPAVQIGQATLFVQRAGRRVMEMSYQFEADAYASPDLTVLANHVARAGIVAMAWQPEPFRALWCALGDGVLIGLTYMREQRVVAWHRHALGGGGKVRSIACIPSADANELWAVVERTVDGGTRRYVERMEPEFWGETAAELARAAFVDAAISYDGAAVTALAGLDHLEGLTVQVLADGAAHPDAVVSGGAIALTRAASVVQVGLGYPSRLETLDLDAGAVDGTAATRRRRIGEIGVRLFQSLGCTVGYRNAETGQDVLEEVQFREAWQAMGAPPPVFSGDKVVTFPGGWDRACRVVVRQDQPLPLTVTGLVPRITATE
ncbi:MAG: hypothetical protein K2X74_00490 [Acetobacteraceae bacterium]|nr:hypothetical protein [Acetobacteraceae bacterium]